MGNRTSTPTEDDVESGNVNKDHNLNLVLSVLPVMADYSKELEKRIMKRDKRYGYLGNVQASAGTLTDRLEEIRRNGEIETFKSQIEELVDCLEEIASELMIKPSWLKASKHPRLHAVRDTVSKSKVRKLYTFESSTLKSTTAWNNLQRNLGRLSDELQSYGDNVDETEEDNLLKTPQEPTAEVYDFVNRALDRVLCRCQAKPEREIRLRMGTYKKQQSKPRPKSLCVLLTKRGSLPPWHELSIHNQRETVHGYQHRPGSTSCICNYLNEHSRPEHLRLDIILHRDALHLPGDIPHPCTFQPESLQEQIDLRSLLCCETKRWKEPSKWALAVILAYSLLYLYCGSQARGRWRRENIHFFKDGAHIPLQPFFDPSASQRCNELANHTIKFHHYPEILELGVILLEIHLGQTLQAFLKGGQENMCDNVSYWDACAAFRKEEHQIISIAYRNAIRACLSPLTFDGTDNNVQKLRSVLFEKVVRPLEEELAKNFEGLLGPDRLDDEAAEKCDLAISIPSIVRRHSRYGRTVQRQKGDVPSRKVRWADSSNEPRIIPERWRGGTVSPQAILSDARKSDKDTRMTSHWPEWLDDFETKFRRKILPYAIDPDQQRVRVTVIDTGIDGSHPFIRSKGWTVDDECPLFCDFVEPCSGRSKYDPIDEDGHGTFIAGVLLQVAPDIELSIARIGATRKTIQNDAQIGNKIGCAIEHAINTWKTEIISISYGSEDMSSEILDAIVKADQHNVIILAAAGNTGNRRGVSYPAKIDRVFSIFAANDSGYAADFSPPVDDQKIQNYFIMGCGIHSIWPSSLRDEAEADGLDVFCHGSPDGHEHSEECDTRIVMSGTSFATPIAAALVAIIYQFYDVNKSWKETQVKLRPGSEDKSGSKDKFKTRDAVRAILSKMSRISPQAPYKFLEPARGKDDFFLFRPYKDPERNIHGQTPVQFFSYQLSNVLLSDNI